MSLFLLSVTSANHQLCLTIRLMFSSLPLEMSLIEKMYFYEIAEKKNESEFYVKIRMISEIYNRDVIYKR